MQNFIVGDTEVYAGWYSIQGDKFNADLYWILDSVILKFKYIYTEVHRGGTVIYAEL